MEQTAAKIRELFINRMTIDSEHHDRRKRDYNQAIFIRSEDEWLNGRPVFNGLDMDMVLQCFDDAIRDYRDAFCDEKRCHRK